MEKERITPTLRWNPEWPKKGHKKIRTNTLNYDFRVHNIKNLKPGHSESSICRPTHQTHFGQPVIFSPSGFPLQFSLHLIYERPSKEMRRFRFQIRLHQPSTRTFYPPPVQIQPLELTLPRDCYFSIYEWRTERLVTLEQPASWGFKVFIKDLRRHNEQKRSHHHRYQLDMAGQFWFKLLNEPMFFLNPPLTSKAKWSCLHGDMVAAVLRKLPLVYRVHARLACRSWARILDTDNLAWSNVTYVQGNCVCLEYKQEDVPYDERLNAVRDDQLLQALDFLANRRAPISTLKITCRIFTDTSSRLVKMLNNIASLLSESGISLKTLAFHSKGCEVGKLTSALVNIITSQPNLEQLYLQDHLEYDPPRELALSPSLLPVLPRLRILSLCINGQEQTTLTLNAFRTQSQLLQSLFALRLCLHWRFYTQHDQLLSFLAALSDIVGGEGRDLKRVVSTERPNWEDQSAFDCNLLDWPEHNEVLWATAALKPSAADALLLPIHHYHCTEGCFFSHYRCIL